jgi:dTDP-4-amino-4,6-dideoxygalactose transaminase
LDFERELASIRGDISSAIERVLDSGWFIRGDEVKCFEAEFSSFVGTRLAQVLIPARTLYTSP